MFIFFVLIINFIRLKHFQICNLNRIVELITFQTFEIVSILNINFPCTLTVIIYYFYQVEFAKLVT